MCLAKHKEASEMVQGAQAQRRRTVFGGGSSTAGERDRGWTRGR